MNCKCDTEELGELTDMCLQKESRKVARARVSRRLASDSRGSELLEFAFVLPILVMILLGVVWVGRMISVYQALGRAAHDGAAAYLASTCASCGNAQVDPTTAIQNALTAASLDPSQETGPTFQANTTIDPSDPANYQVSGVTVSVGYTVQLNIPFTPLNGVTVPLTATVTMRQEY